MDIFKNNVINDHLPVGYGLHKLLLDESGNPRDYRFVEINNKFEEFTGLKKIDIVGKTYLEVLPATVDSDCDWIACYGNLVLNMEIGDFSAYSEPIGRNYRIFVVPLEGLYFVTFFTDNTIEIENETKIDALQEALEYNKCRLDTSIESLNDLVIFSLDRDYCYLFFNDVHQHDMKKNFKADLVIGDCIFDYMSNEGEISKIKEAYDIALRGSVHTTYEKYEEISDAYYEAQYNPLFDQNKEVIGITVIAHNITDKTFMKSAIVQSEKRYKGLVDNLDTAVVVHATDSNIISCNPKASEILGITMNELIGTYAYDPGFALNNEDGSRMKYEDYPINVILRTKRPIKKKTMIVENLKLGKSTWISVNGVPIFDEDKKVTEVIISFEDISEQKSIKRKLEVSANNDALTGLHNRRYFDDNLGLYDVPENYPLAIIMADINGLKLNNDAFGHKAGDNLIALTAKLLLDYSNERDLLARIGGDEFVLIAPKTSEDDALKLIQKIKSQASLNKLQAIPLSISFGYTTKKEESQRIQDLYIHAEDMMYREKLLESTSMRGSAIQTILKTLSEKDASSEEHSMVVSRLSEEFAKFNQMTKHDIVEIRTAGLLHDIGKIIIPTAIIAKEGLLTKEEYAIVKKHPEIGYRILNATYDMRNISEIILNHHERCDGQGYPRGVKSDQIPIKSRIIAIADAFEAMTSKRTYRLQKTKLEALEELKRCSGTQFDAELVELFEENFAEIMLALEK